MKFLLLFSLILLNLYIIVFIIWYIKIKFKHKMVIKGSDIANNELRFGLFGLKILQNCEITIIHLKIIKRLFSSVFKKEVKLWYRLPAPRPKTVRPLGSRMGSGKSPILYYSYPLKKGRILIEWSCLNFRSNKNLFLILKTKFGSLVEGVERLSLL